MSDVDRRGEDQTEAGVGGEDSRVKPPARRGRPKGSRNKPRDDRSGKNRIKPEASVSENGIKIIRESKKTDSDQRDDMIFWLKANAYFVSRSGLDFADWIVLFEDMYRSK